MIPRAAKLCVSRLTKGSAFILMLWMHSAGGWRPLAEHDECLIPAADLIRDYREHHQLEDTLSATQFAWLGYLLFTWRDKLPAVLPVPTSTKPSSTYS